MPDLKKTIVELDRITSVMKDSLVLLIEQQGYIDAFNEVNEQNNRLYDKINKLLSEQPQIVRCKDCKHWKGKTCYNRIIPCPQPDADWFCADGEKRE